MPVSHRNRHHRDIGMEKKAMGERRVKQAREHIFLLVGHDYEVNMAFLAESLKIIHYIAGRHRDFLVIEAWVMLPAIFQQRFDR